MFSWGGQATLNNISFHGNSADGGGALYNFFSSPTLNHVSFSDNQTALTGGGLFNNNSSPTLHQVSFSGNRATTDGGGIRNTSNSHPILVNVLFSGNLAGGDGGGISNNSSNPTLTNVTFSGNRANVGGAMHNNNSNPAIRNSILWHNQDNSGLGTAGASIHNAGTSNPAIGYSLVQGCNPNEVWVGSCGTDGDNNLADADPLFVETPDLELDPVPEGNLRLRARSPGVDAGNNSLNTTELDLAGNVRVFGGTIDLGAYETPYLSVSLSTAGSGSGSATIESPLPARFDPGDSVTVTAAPATSSNFTGWSGDLTATVNPLVFTINNDTALTAHFVLKTFEVIATESGNGTITPSSQTVDYDDTASFTVTPNAGWSIDTVSGDPCNPVLVNGDQWQAANITENCTVQASFVINQYAVGGQVSGLQGTGLTLDLNGIETLPIGTDGLFSFITKLDHASNYTVTVASQPTDPLQLCTLTNSAGTINAADASDIEVDCAVRPDMIFSDRYQD